MVKTFLSDLFILLRWTKWLGEYSNLDNILFKSNDTSRMETWCLFITMMKIQWRDVILCWQKNAW